MCSTTSAVQPIISLSIASQVSHTAASSFDSAKAYAPIATASLVPSRDTPIGSLGSGSNATRRVDPGTQISAPPPSTNAVRSTGRKQAING